MTVPVCYTAEGRRYSRSYHTPYYTDRRYLPSHDHAHTQSGRTTTAMAEREPEGESNPPRKRIAVACSRCRKRKIRCSGDPGHGQPCNNCKNAGAEPCRFLRVSSTETPLRNDSGEFTYDLQSARAYQVRGGAMASMGPVASQFPAEGIPAMASGEMLGPYRHGAGSAYPYAAAASKGYYGPAVSAWSHGYADDGVDYGLQLSTTTKYEGGTSPATYLSMDHSYGFASSATTGLVHRAAPAPAPPSLITAAEIPNFSLSTVAASLPTQLHGLSSKDRLLSGPSSRTLPSSAPYRGDYQTTASKLSSSTHRSPSVSAIADVGTYASFDGSYSAQQQPVTLPSHGSTTSSSSSSSRGADAYSPTGRPGSDLYSTSGRVSDVYSSASDSIFSAAETSLRTQSSESELGYQYSNSRRDMGGDDDGGGESGQLANGHVYTSLPPPPGGGGYILGEVVEDRRVTAVNTA